MIRLPPKSTPVPNTTLFQSGPTAAAPRPATRAGRRGSTAAGPRSGRSTRPARRRAAGRRSEEHTSELQSRQYLVCRLLLEKKKLLTYILLNYLNTFSLVLTY